MANVLAVNAGSSSVKLALYQGESFTLNCPEKPAWSHSVSIDDAMDMDKRKALLIAEITKLWAGSAAVLESPSQLTAIGHRVVHGGPHYSKSVIVDAEVKKNIAEYAQFAPLQNPYNLLGIEVMESLAPSVTQVAVFDTAFHASLPDVTRLYPLPRNWDEQYGIRRYGFHGISHFYVSQRAASMLQNETNSLRTVTCHLGNGCSLAAVIGGKSIDTTMGFSTLDGLMMGTRCGSLDPGIPLYLLQNNRISQQKLEHAFYHQSGLLGVSGVSNDMREIVRSAASGDKNARLAFEMFIDRLSKGIASMAVALKGLDCLVFTAGIGENSAEVRAAACEQLAFLGINVDAAKNEATDGDRLITSERSKPFVMVIRTHEDWVIAHDCWQLVHE